MDIIKKITLMPKGSDLNKATKQEHITIDEITSRIDRDTLSRKHDAHSGYCLFSFDEASQILTMFHLPYG